MADDEAALVEGGDLHGLVEAGEVAALWPAERLGGGRAGHRADLVLRHDDGAGLGDVVEEPAAGRADGVEEGVGRGVDVRLLVVAELVVGERELARVLGEELAAEAGRVPVVALGELGEGADLGPADEPELGVPAVPVADQHVDAGGAVEVDLDRGVAGELGLEAGAEDAARADLVVVLLAARDLLLVRLVDARALGVGDRGGLKGALDRGVRPRGAGGVDAVAPLGAGGRVVGVALAAIVGGADEQARLYGAERRAVG